MICKTVQDYTICTQQVITMDYCLNLHLHIVSWSLLMQHPDSYLTRRSVIAQALCSLNLQQIARWIGMGAVLWHSLFRNSSRSFLVVWDAVLKMTRIVGRIRWLYSLYRTFLIPTFCLTLLRSLNFSFWVVLNVTCLSVYKLSGSMFEYQWVLRSQYLMIEGRYMPYEIHFVVQWFAAHVTIVVHLTHCIKHVPLL